MKRAVPLSSLSPGRCFTLAAPPAQDEDEDGKAFRQGQSILSADAVWKVVSTGADDSRVENAAGESDTLPGATSVLEVPRQGFDRLAQRARE